MDFSEELGTTLILTSVLTSATFLVLQHMKAALQGGHRVLVLPMEQTAAQYGHALKKMGVSTAEQQRLVSLDVRPHLLGLDNDSMTGVARRLHGLVHEALQSNAGEDVGSLLVVDALTALHSSGLPEQDWHALLHGLCSVASSSQGRFNCLLVAAEDAPEDQAWIRSLQHRANTVLHVEPMKGRVADIDGQVTLERRTIAASTCHIVRPLCSTYFFKSSDAATTFVDVSGGRHIL